MNVSYTDAGLAFTSNEYGFPILWENVKFEKIMFDEPSKEQPWLKGFMMFKHYKPFQDKRRGRGDSLIDDKVRNNNYVIMDYIPYNFISETGEPVLEEQEKEGPYKIDLENIKTYHWVKKQKLSLQIQELRFLDRAIRMKPFEKEQYQEDAAPVRNDSEFLSQEAEEFLQRFRHKEMLKDVIKKKNNGTSFDELDESQSYDSNI